MGPSLILGPSLNCSGATEGENGHYWAEPYTVGRSLCELGSIEGNNGDTVAVDAHSGDTTGSKAQ